MSDESKLPDVKYLEPKTVALRRGDREAPHATIDGDRTYLDTRVRLAFPQSLPDQYIVLHDSKDNVIGMLLTIEGLDELSTAIVKEELDRRYFRPQVVRVLKLHEEYGCTEFEVETTRGLVTFRVRGVNENVREGPNGTFRIRDIHGSIFEVPPLDELDPVSRSRMETIV
jgi:hypothetical protein